MSTISNSAVVQAFLTDHRKFMKLLREVGLALDDADRQRARRLAQQLNQVGGPHIAFEEAVLYPALEAQSSDRSFVPELYDEHRAIVRALARLLGDEEIDDQGLAALQAAFREGLEHAEHCGTLVSRLSSLDRVDQQEALDELIQFRKSKITWLELQKDS